MSKFVSDKIKERARHEAMMASADFELWWQRELSISDAIVRLHLRLMGVEK